MLIRAVSRLIHGDVEANIQGIQADIQSKHVCAHSGCLRSLFLAHDVPEHSNNQSKFKTSCMIKILNEAVADELKILQ